jgi:transcriptional regulator with XRE-family HTH domain
MKIKELCNKYGIIQKELVKLSGVSYGDIEKEKHEGIHMISSINLFRLSLVLGCEDGKGYELIDVNVKERAIKEVKANFIRELAETEIDDCISNEYVGDYECLYDFCASNVDNDSYKNNVEYRYPTLLKIMSYLEIQEAVKNEIKELMNARWGL